MKKILVLGSSGYLGSNITQFFVTEFDKTAEVFLYQRFEKKHSSFSRIKRYFHGDILSQQTLDTIFQYQYDVIIFALGMTNPYVINSNLDLSYKINVASLQKVVDSVCATQERNPTFIFLSSRQEYGFAEEPRVNESQERLPISKYGKQKKEASDYLLSNFSDKYRPIVLIISNIYGFKPNTKQSSYNTTHALIRQALNTGKIQVFGSGSQLRDFLFIDDFLFLLSKCVDASLKEHMYNVGSSECISIKNVCDTIAKYTQAEVEHSEWDSVYKENEVGDFCIHAAKIMSELGWKQATLLDEGIQKTVAYLNAEKK